MTSFNTILKYIHAACWKLCWVTDEGSVPEIVQYDPSSRSECFTASKGSNNYFYLQSIFPIFDHLQLNNVNAFFVYCIYEYVIPKQILDFST